VRPHETGPLSDTSADAEEVLIARLRAMSPAERLRLVQKLNRGLIQLSIAGIRKRYGDIDDRELRLRLGALRLPRVTMVRVFGWDPEREGY